MKSSATKSIVWFRQDLRLADNPALFEAARLGAVLPVFIHDDHNAGAWKDGGASRVWLHHSLAALNSSLDGKLSIYHGDAQEILLALCERLNIDNVYWNRCYEPFAIARDKAIKEKLSEISVDAKSFNGSLLWEPWQVSKADGTPYRVFTPFYRKGCLDGPEPRPPLPKPKKLTLVSDDQALPLSQLALLPEDVRWDQPIEEAWQFGEEAALEQLQVFLSDGIKGYKDGRNFPAQLNNSHLSPYLHRGEISPNTVWYAARAIGDDADIDHFCTELGWREFSYSLLFHFPDLPVKNFQPKFDDFPWTNDDAAFHAWSKGQTGVPIVDAGMRELWQTGFMHNRVRMIVASYLTKNLKIDWREGAKWFWDTLVDADLANNSASWQWVAGSGADAAPYFRIFNPVTQSERFDPEAAYIRQYVPELAKLDDKLIRQPWCAPDDALDKAGVELGTTYPHPLVDLKASREDALAAFKTIRNVGK